MHSLLEDYLLEVDVYLESMPFKRRNEELCEMLVHLENAVIVSRELGQTENEAVQSAVAQFGTPQDLGESVVRAWRRGVTQDRRSVLGAATTAALMIHLGFEARSHNLFNSIFSQTFFRYIGEHTDNVLDDTEVMILMIFGLAGIVVGCLFPKRAIRGVCLGLAFYQLGSIAIFGLAPGGVWRFLSLTFGWSLAAIIGAWAGSRLQLMWRTKRSLLARS